MTNALPFFATPSSPRSAASGSARWALAACTAAAMLLTVSGCGRSEANASKSTQVVAKVNSEEISVHQVNFLLQRTPGITSDNADAASRQILERLIGQELAVQQAQQLKLDRNPSVVQAMEAARRDVLARAFLDRLGEGIGKPTPEEVSEFYAKRPALFKQRKVYQLQEANIAANEAEVKTVRERMAAARNPGEFVTWLRGSGLRSQVGNPATVPAENVPLELLDRLAATADGNALLVPQNGGVKVVMVLRSEAAAVDEATARPAIEQFIVNDRRRAKVDADMKALRGNAKVEFYGKFAEAAPAAAATPAAATAPAAADAMSGDAVKKGLGLK